MFTGFLRVRGGRAAGPSGTLCAMPVPPSPSVSGRWRARVVGACIGTAAILGLAVAPAVAARVPRVTGLVVTARTTTSIDIYWRAPRVARLRGIVVRRAAGGAAPATPAAGAAVTVHGAAAVSAVDIALTPGTVYSYAVFVRTASGRVSPAATLTTRTDATGAVPLAAPRLTLVRGPVRLAVARFAPVPGATGYSYRMCAAVGGCGPRTPVTPSGRLMTGLRPGVRYTVQLMAIGDGVAAADSPAAVAVGIPAGPRLPAPRLVVTAGPGTLRVAAFPGILHAQGYRTRLCNRAGAYCAPPAPLSSRGATFRRLGGGVVYTVELTANANGVRYSSSVAAARRATVGAFPLAPPVGRNAGCAPVTIAQENAKAGGTGWQPTSGLISPLVQGYVDQTSAACGSEVGLYLGTRSPTPVRVQVQAWRLGSYGGAGGRLVWTGPTFAVAEPGRWETVASTTFEVTAPWLRAATLAIPHTWTEGMYELRIVPVGNPGAAAAVPLVVRDDTRTTPLVQVVATNTDQMYNTWGGHSAYSTASGISTVVSLLRPYDGFGMAQILNDEQPLAQFVESQGRSVSYVTDGDLDIGSREVSAARAIMIGSHSEYWTPGMRTHLQAALAHGANATFFGANSMYWHAVPTSHAGRYTALDIWKLNPADPHASSPALVSTMWRLPPISNPEQMVLGEEFGCTDVLLPMTVPTTLGWVFDRTGATAGQQLQGVIYQETDTPTSGAPMPAGTRVVTSRTFACPQRAAGFTSGSAVTLVPQPKGGLVVDVGTRGWVCLLNSSCVTNPVYSDPALLAADPDIDTTTVRNDPAVASVIRNATTNILNAVSAGPAAGYATTSPYPLAPGA